MGANVAVELESVTKRFGDVLAVRDMSLRVVDGEFFSLLGPSGCGKTTTLRMIGGFEIPSQGEIYIGGQAQGFTPAYKRPVNTVFQNYALFPHMSVFENVAFGLEMQKVPKGEVRRRVQDALEMVRLSGMESRRPKQLSGGQQQRVALARALINRPKVLLLDEPLGALDLKLRKAMQLELKELQNRVGITFIYVTHDQEEALTMSDRIGVMNNGELLQVGAAGFDVIVPSDYMVDIMIGEGLLAELDKSKLTNIGNLDPRFTDPPFDPGMEHCAPYQWGTTGIGYNSEFFDEPPNSWAYIFDPEVAVEFAGKMTMLNDSREAFAAVLKYLGYSVNSTDQAQLEAARDLLIQQKQWVMSYDSEQYEDLMSADETVIAHGWSGDFFTAAVDDERIWYAIPEEGGVVWVDNMCIPATAPNPDAAHLFIDYIMRPEVAAKVTNFTWYASPNTAAEAFILEDILGEPAIYPPPEVMSRLEFIEDVGDTAPLIEQFWTEVKAAGT